jgi:hypothetical protein
MSQRVRRIVAIVGAPLMLMIAMAMPSVAEESKVSQVAGVDNTSMGPYRALAQLSFEAFQRKDARTAAELSRILERTWDAAEEHGGANSLGIRNKQLFEEIDEAMDAFIKPIIHYTTETPDTLAVTTAYKVFLSKLKQGDESAK